MSNCKLRDLSCLEVLDAVLGELQDVVLIDVVRWVSAEVRRAIGVLHREVEATVADADDGALELGVALLSLPYVELADPVNLAVPCGERIDAIYLCELSVASFFLIAYARES